MSVIHTIPKLLRPHTLTALAALSVLLFLLLFPKGAADAVNHALVLCVGTVIPSLFPFFVLNELLISAGFAGYIGRWLEKPFRFLFGIRGSCASVFFLGLLSGYPTGAKMTVDLYDQGLCSKEEAERLLAFCNNAGPAFLIGGIGSAIFGKPEIGAMLYGIQILSAVLVGIMENLFFRDKSETVPQEKTPAKAPVQSASGFAIFAQAIRSAALSMLTVCGSIVFFSVLIAMAAVLLTGHRQLYLGGCVFLELTTACAEAAALLPKRLALLAVSAAVGWSGCSVHLQVASFTGGRLSLSRYFSGKLFGCIFSILLTACLFMNHLL